MTDERVLSDAISDWQRPVALRGCPAGWEVTSEEDAEVWAPACRPEDLGDASFRETYSLRYAYVAGAMATGSLRSEMVEKLARAGMLGFFGAAGLALEVIEQAVVRLQTALPDRPFGVNLIHTPNDPAWENEVVDLCLRRKVRLVEASAYLDLTPAVVRYRLQGLREDASGGVTAPNRVIAKVSRIEVASKFFAPAPERIVAELLRQGQISQEEARLACRIPLAQDVTAEADSGGHTDNRPLVTLLPTLIALRDRLQEQYDYAEPLRVGAAGGISTPAAAAAAFAMGAAYVLTGSVNQACVESGSSDLVRGMLAQAEQADVTMAPAADMFEMGVKVQVLKRGTMFAMRAAKLYELYRTHGSLEELPAVERAALEKNLFRASLDEIWNQTRAYFQSRDPQQLARAEREPKHRMALVFRWYLGQSSRWANAGDPGRKLDYQVWCGPSMGAFNEWVKGSFLEEPANRTVVAVALNLMHGAAVLLRLQMLRCQGVTAPAGASRWIPRELDRLAERLPRTRVPA